MPSNHVPQWENHLLILMKGIPLTFTNSTVTAFKAGPNHFRCPNIIGNRNTMKYFIITYSTKGPFSTFMESTIFTAIWQDPYYLCTFNLMMQQYPHQHSQSQIHQSTFDITYNCKHIQRVEESSNEYIMTSLREKTQERNAINLGCLGYTSHCTTHYNIKPL